MAVFHSPSRRNSQRSPWLAPGARLAVAIAPALTIGLVRPSGPRSTAASELKASPVAFAPSWSLASSGPRAWQTRGPSLQLSLNRQPPGPMTIDLVPRVTIHVGGPERLGRAGMHRQPAATEFHKARRPWFNCRCLHRFPPHR